MRIIILEDEPLVALLMQDTLEDAGYEVMGPCATVAEALVLAEGARPDLALVDIRLKGSENGIAAARAFHHRWNVPSLFVSGQISEAEGATDGALGLLRKPYSSETLLRSIEVVSALREGRVPGRLPPGLQLFGSEQ